MGDQCRLNLDDSACRECGERVFIARDRKTLAAVRIYNKGMRAVHTFCALALTTQSFPRAPFTLAGPPFGPINHHNTPDTGLALHTTPRPTCARTLTFPHLSARGPSTALGARTTPLCCAKLHLPRTHRTHPTCSTRLPALPNIAKLLPRPLVPFFSGRLSGPPPTRLTYRLCRDGNQPEINPTLRPSSIPILDASRTRNLTPTCAGTHAQTPTRSTPANSPHTSELQPTHLPPRTNSTNARFERNGCCGMHGSRTEQRNTALERCERNTIASARVLNR